MRAVILKASDGALTTIAKVKGGGSWPKSISTLGQKARLLKCALKGSKHALIFFRLALPHRYLHTRSSTRIILERLSGILPYSQKWHNSLDRKCMRPRNVGATRATLTREDSEWSRKFEEPWLSRPRGLERGGALFSPRPSQRACQDPLTWCEAKPTTLKRPSPGDGFENHMCHIKLVITWDVTPISMSSQLTQSHDVLWMLASWLVVELAFSRVQPAALATPHYTLLTKALSQCHQTSNPLHKVSLRLKHNFTPSLTLFIFLGIIIKHQNLTPNGFKGLITHVGTILGSHVARWRCSKGHFTHENESPWPWWTTTIKDHKTLPKPRSVITGPQV